MHPVLKYEAIVYSDIHTHPLTPTCILKTDVVFVYLSESYCFEKQDISYAFIKHLMLVYHFSKVRQFLILNR